MEILALVGMYFTIKTRPSYHFSSSVVASSLSSGPLVPRPIVYPSLSGVVASCHPEQVLDGWNLGYGGKQEVEEAENQDVISHFLTKLGTSPCYQILVLKSLRCDANGEILRFHMQIGIPYLQSGRC